MSKLKYFADLHISPLTCKLLRKAGYHIFRVNDVLPSTAPDLQIIEYARQQNLVILTQDLDFSALLALANVSGPSIVSLRLANTDPEAIAEVLIRLLPMVEEDLAKGAIVSVTEQKVRVRLLSIYEIRQ